MLREIQKELFVFDKNLSASGKKYVLIFRKTVYLLMKLVLILKWCVVELGQELVNQLKSRFTAEKVSTLVLSAVSLPLALSIYPRLNLFNKAMSTNLKKNFPNLNQKRERPKLRQKSLWSRAQHPTTLLNSFKLSWMCLINMVRMGFISSWIIVRSIILLL